MSRKHKLSHDEKKKLEHECLECEHIPCVNFYRKSSTPFMGGEIYVLRSLSEKKKRFPCEIGSLIYTLCQLSSPLSDFPSNKMFEQCIRDMKASAYLLLSCHYRSSIQLLRPVVENYVAVLYWDAKFFLAGSDERELKDVEKAYSNFLKDKYEIPIAEWNEAFPKDTRRAKKKLDVDYCLSWMVKKQTINGRFKNEITELVRELNKYLHPRGLRFTEAEKPDCPDCASFVRYQEDEHQKCVGFFQDVASLLISILYTYISVYFPDKIDSEEIGEIMGFPMVLRNLEKKFHTQLIFSEKLRSFLSQFETPNENKKFK